MYGEFSKGHVWAVYAGMQSGDGQTREWKGVWQEWCPRLESNLSDMYLIVL